MNDLVELERVEKTEMELMIETLVQTDLNVNDYYCITVRKYGISFQGQYKSETVKNLIEKGYNHRINTQGYVELTSGAIEITLT